MLVAVVERRQELALIRVLVVVVAGVLVLLSRVVIPSHVVLLIKERHAATAEQ